MWTVPNQVTLKINNSHNTEQPNDNSYIITSRPHTTAQFVSLCFVVYLIVESCVSRVRWLKALPCKLAEEQEIGGEGRRRGFYLVISNELILYLDLSLLFASVILFFSPFGWGSRLVARHLCNRQQRARNAQQTLGAITLHYDQFSLFFFLISRYFAYALKKAIFEWRV